jgi:hypothetical protein
LLLLLSVCPIAANLKVIVTACFPSLFPYVYKLVFTVVIGISAVAVLLLLMLCDDTAPAPLVDIKTEVRNVLQ